MTEYDFYKHILDTFGAIALTLAITGVIGYKFIGSYLKSKLDERVTRLEHDFQEALAHINSYHAISKATLEKAFQKKIEVYEQLLEKVNNRSRFINENPIHDEPDSEEQHLSYFLSVIRIIENNRLYITSDLASKHEAWYQAARQYIKASNDSEHEAWQQSYGTDEDRAAAYYAGLPDMLTMMEQTKTEFECLLKCIDQDIRQIRYSLEQPMKAESEQLNRSEG